MNYRKHRAIDQLYFGYHELARVLDISIDAARATAVRYVQQGFLVRLKRNVYVRADRWEHLTTPELFALANVGQTPSYVSLMSALCFYQVSTQIQRGFVESVAVHRTTTIEVGGVVFSYVKVKPALYGGFSRREGFFIAEPEKAYVDARCFLRDFFDIEFILRRGGVLNVAAATRDELARIMRTFTKRDFTTILGSVLEQEERAYYVKHGFAYLRSRLELQDGA